MNKENKTVKEFAKEMESVFGSVDYKLVNEKTGQVVKSLGFQEIQKPLFEMDGGDYLALGGNKNFDVTPGVVANVLNANNFFVKNSGAQKGLKK